MNYKKILLLIILIGLYFLLKYKIPYGYYVIYPITLFVTFLHEFGHSFAALITGGDVYSIKIDSNGAGLATTSGGLRSIVLMGGYIGSAIFGNLLLYIGFKKKKYAEFIVYFIAILMIFVSIYWYSNLITSFILLCLSILLYLLAKYTNYDALILQFLGITSILYILEDYNVGPSSDIAKFSNIFIFIPESVWKYIWLLIVLFITIFNFRLILKK